jgi:hypothetical protein
MASIRAQGVWRLGASPHRAVLEFRCIGEAGMATDGGRSEHPIGGRGKTGKVRSRRSGFRRGKAICPDTSLRSQSIAVASRHQAGNRIEIPLEEGKRSFGGIHPDASASRRCEFSGAAVRPMRPIRLIGPIPGRRTVGRARASPPGRVASAVLFTRPSDADDNVIADSIFSSRTGERRSSLLSIGTLWHSGAVGLRLSSPLVDC